MKISKTEKLMINKVVSDVSKALQISKDTEHELKDHINNYVDRNLEMGYKTSRTFMIDRVREFFKIDEHEVLTSK